MGGDAPHHRSVVLPETDEPEEAPVGKPVEAGPRSVRSGDGEPKLADASHAGTVGGRSGNGFGSVRFDAQGIQGFHRSSPPAGGPTEGEAFRGGGPGTAQTIPSPSFEGPRPRPDRRGTRRSGDPAVGREDVRRRRMPPFARYDRPVRPGVRTRAAASKFPSFKATPSAGRSGAEPPARSRGGREVRDGRRRRSSGEPGGTGRETSGSERGPNGPGRRTTAGATRCRSSVREHQARSGASA